jgi:hypothetical protein
MPGRERLAATLHHLTDQRLEGWLAQTPRGLADAWPGALSRHPARPYLSEVRSLTLDGFEQAPQITRVRDDEGTRTRAVPRAHQLEGAPHVVLESQRGQLVGGSHRGRASAPSVPSERDRAPPSKPTQAL